MIQICLKVGALCTAFLLPGMETGIETVEYYSDEQISVHTQLRDIAQEKVSPTLLKLAAEKEIAALIAAAQHKGPVFVPQNEAILSSRFAEPIVYASKGDIAWWRMHDTPGTPQQLQLASLSDPTRKIAEYPYVINNPSKRDAGLLCISDSGKYFLARNKDVHTVVSVSSTDQRYNFFGFSWTSYAFIGDELLLCHDDTAVELIGIHNGSMHHTILEPKKTGYEFAATDTPQNPRLIGLSENCIAVKLRNKNAGVEQYVVYAGAGHSWQPIGAIASKKSFDAAHVIAHDGDLFVLEQGVECAILSRWYVDKKKLFSTHVSTIPDVEKILSCDLYAKRALITRIAQSTKQSVIDILPIFGTKRISLGLATICKAFWSRAEESVISLISTCGGVPGPCTFAIDIDPSPLSISSELMQALKIKYETCAKKSDT